MHLTTPEWGKEPQRGGFVLGPPLPHNDWIVKYTEGVTRWLTLNSKEDKRGPDYNETINVLVTSLLPLNCKFSLQYMFGHSR